MELPEKYKENMQSLLGKDYPRYLASLDQPAKKGFRVNFEYRFFKRGFDETPIEHLYGCFTTNSKVGSTLEHHLGVVYSQEPSAMLAAEVLDVAEGEKVLDLCAAPGGKASRILENDTKGTVVLNEVVRQRAMVLVGNIERQGFKNAIVTNDTPEVLAKQLPNFFDKILVDAPCSGEGMFRKDPDTIGEWNEGLPEFNHKRQLEILAQADKMLRQWGILVYSTCTFNRVENEETVCEFCEKYGYDVIPLQPVVRLKTSPGISIKPEIKTELCGRCYPFDGFGEGQFIARLIKKAPVSVENCVKLDQKGLIMTQSELKIAKTLLHECLIDENLPLYKSGNTVFTYPGEAKRIHYCLLYGVRIGDIVNGRIVPHHQFFKAFYKLFKNKLELGRDDPRVKEYISGNEIDCPLSGYTCVLVDGIPLGGGKASGGKLKNYYPKGLRQNLKY